MLLCSRLHVSELVVIYIALHMNDFGCLQENWLQSSSQFYSNVKWVAYFCRTELQCFCVWSLCTFKQCLVFRPPLVLCSMYIRTWWIQLYRSYKYKGKIACTRNSTSSGHNSNTPPCYCSLIPLNQAQSKIPDRSGWHCIGKVCFAKKRHRHLAVGDNLLEDTSQAFALLEAGPTIPHPECCSIR